MAKSTTPLMQQYQAIKKNYPDYLILFQMGDFYETFHEDAKEIAQALDIVLTSREKERQTPMAGFPIKAIDDYLPKLIKAGYKIAIADQIGDPAQAVGIVERKVTQLITPGTVVLDNALDQRRNNYLLALWYGNRRNKRLSRVGIAFIDASTGAFYLLEEPATTIERLRDQLRSWQPAEVIIPDKGDYQFLNEFRLQPIPAKQFRYADQYQRLLDHFQLPNLDGWGVQDFPLGLTAAGVILQYVQEQRQTVPRQITSLRQWHNEEYMHLDPVTNSNLGVTSGAHTLYQALDHCRTAMGHRLLFHWLSHPSVDLAVINQRLDTAQFGLEHLKVVTATQDDLSAIGDLERLTARLGVQDISPRHLQAINTSIQKLLAIANSLAPSQKEIALPPLTSAQQKELRQAQELLQTALLENPSNDLRAGGIFRPEYNQEVAELRRLTADRNQTLADIVAAEKEKHHISTMRIGYNRVFGYYLEIPHTHRDKVPNDYIRKQTLVNAERYITEELKHLEEEILAAEGKLVALEQQLFHELVEQLLPYIPVLQAAAQWVAHLDVLFNFAQLAEERDYHRPVILPMNDHLLEIIQGRHPVVELTLDQDFIPNDTLFNETDHNLIILTGPNMAGKSTYIRQIALLVIMAQAGSYIPAEQAQISVVDRIFARVGAGDDIATGRSTFMVEMSEAANIIRNATANSLVILDELGRGTSTYDGLSLAWAISKYLRQHVGAKTILATHYHEMTTLADGDEGIKNYTTSVAEDNDTVQFLRTIKPGKADKSYGIYVGQLVGLPPEIIREAKEVLHHLEKNHGRITFIKQPTLLGQPAKQKPPVSDNRLTEIENLLNSFNVNEITPVQALALVEKLKLKLKK